MPVGDRPVLDIIIRQLRHHGFGHVTIATGWLAELIEAYFGDGRQYGITIDYHRAHERLGTIGAIACLDGLDDDFLVINGDVVTDLDFRALMRHHGQTDAIATIRVLLARRRRRRGLRARGRGVRDRAGPAAPSRTRFRLSGRRRVMRV
jgi:NDP-sugar pyrophosphorylase family protein